LTLLFVPLVIVTHTTGAAGAVALSRDTLGTLVVGLHEHE